MRIDNKIYETYVHIKYNIKTMKKIKNKIKEKEKQIT